MERWRSSSMLKAASVPHPIERVAMLDLRSPAPTSHDLFDTLFDSFVISLKRQPEKLQAFIARNRPSGIDFRHFEAVDGARCNIFDLIGGQVVARGAVNYTPGAIGNALSHLALWRRCVEQGRHLVIFEDDAVVRNDFKARLSPLAGQGDDWDIILLGYNTDAVLELNIAPGIDLGGVFSIDYPTPEHLADFAHANSPVGLQRLVTAMGTCGYALAPKGAERLIRGCFPMDNRPVKLRAIGHTFPAYGIDCMMTSVYPKMRAFACVSPLVMTPNNRNVSTTQSK
jgi:glycosyl transferase family 25